MVPLDELRKQLDRIDDEITRLLHRRAQLVLEVKRTKEQGKIDTYSPARERQILDRVTQLVADGEFPRPALERIFGNIISATRSLIGELAVGYVGPEYSLGHEGAVKQFGENVAYTPEPSLEDVFRRVEAGDAHYGVVPARLPGAGTVDATFDRLIDSPLVIIAELDIVERFALAGGASALSQVTEVYADAESYVRTLGWLRTALPLADLRLAENTDRAVQLAGAGASGAAVVLRSAAERRGLTILATGIEGDAPNRARFVVLGRTVPPRTGTDKTSLAVSAPERPGILREILQPFSDQGVTLLQIESRPRRKDRYDYMFFLDAMGHADDQALNDAIQALRSQQYPVKVLGSYPFVCQGAGAA